MSDADRTTERGEVAALGSHFIVPLLACGLTGYYLVSTVSLVWEAKATGIFIGAILLTLCAFQFVRLGLRIARGEGDFGLGELAEDTVFNRQRLALFVLAALFVASLNWLGTTLGLFLVLIASMRILGVRSLRVLVGVAFLAAAIVHFLLIYLLGSQLPQGFVKHLLPFAGGA